MCANVDTAIKPLWKKDPAAENNTGLVEALFQHCEGGNLRRRGSGHHSDQESTQHGKTHTYTLSHTSWILRLYLSDASGLLKRKSTRKTSSPLLQHLCLLQKCYHRHHQYIHHFFFRPDYFFPPYSILTTWISSSVMILFPQNVWLLFPESFLV